MSLQLGLSKHSILSSEDDVNHISEDDMAILASPPLPTTALQVDDIPSQAQALTKRSGNSKAVKAKTKSNPKKSNAGTRDSVNSGWSGIAPLKKLHNIAVSLKSSNILYQSWMRAIRVVLGIDNATRWFSWSDMIEVAVTNRAAIVDWLMENSGSIGDNNLEKDDWDLLQKTHEFLLAFKEATLDAEQGVSSLSDAMEVLDILLIHCQRTRVSRN